MKKYAILLFLTMGLSAGKKKMAKISCLRAECGFVAMVRVEDKKAMCKAHNAQSHSPMRKRYGTWSKFDDWQALFCTVHNIQNKEQYDEKIRETKAKYGDDYARYLEPS